MARKEMRTRYAGTLAGLVWSVVNPLMMIVIYWFVFSVGFKVRPSGNVPFVIVFLCGLIPWVTFSETLSASTTAITGSPHLVKKTVFPTEILPVVHLVASMVTHVIMLIILIVLLAAHRMPFSLYNLQFLYYLFAMSVFCLGLGWAVSALNVFCRDVAHMVTVVINMWFWLTPIVWPLGMLPDKYQHLVRLNPMLYVVNGYRASFIRHAGLWENWRLGAYFWVVALASFAAGGWVFRRSKAEFPESM